MTEAQLTSPIVAAARARGWRVSHDPDSRGQEEGEPDLALLWRGQGPCPGPCAEFEVECKRRGRHRTDGQRRYANDAAVAGKVVLEWLLPDDYDQAERLLGLVPGTLTAGQVAAQERSGARGSAARSRGRATAAPAPVEPGLRQRIAALSAERRAIFQTALDDSFPVGRALVIAERAVVAEAGGT